MATAHKIFPHGPLEPIAPGLWRVVGSLPFPLKRNMFVYRLPDGGLLLYSVVAMDEAGMAALEALGAPTWMVVPHTMHTMDAGFYAERYPNMKVAAPDAVRARRPALRVDATPEAGLAPLGIGVHEVPGGKCAEVVLDLPIEGGRALIFTDLLGQNEGPVNAVVRLMGPPGGAGVARVVKLRQIKDKRAVRGFLERLAETPDLRLIAGCHGGVVDADCAAWLRSAAAGV